jgi:hypothetical protein
MTKKNKTDDSFMKDANERFAESQDGSEYNRIAYENDTKFARLGEQWPEQIRKQREAEGRPALVSNKLPALIRSVVNESRQSKPAINVAPVDNGADQDTADVIGGIIRSVERNSNAPVAYNNAIDNAVTGGFGFFRIDIDYAHPETFDMECRIERISNALSVHWDTTSTRFDAADWGFAFISDHLTKEEYEKKYPGGSLVSWDGDSRDDYADQWMTNDSIRVAEYFKRELKTRNLLHLEIPNMEAGQPSLETVREDELPAMAKAFFEAGGISTDGMSESDLIQGFLEVSGVSEKRRREVEYYDVKRYIVNGVEILKEDDWPGSTIPICPVWGDEVNISGRRYFRSMITDVKDPQMMLNFWKSMSTELVALAPKAPFIGPKGFIPKGQEQKWNTASTRNHAYLEYDATAGPMPQRQGFAGVPAGALQEAMNSNDDIQSITGIYPSAIGARSNETSGKAILARERQGDTANFHFLDNLSHAIQYCGRVLVDVIPAVYSAQEAVRILGADQAQSVIKLTQEAGGAKQGELYNLTVGKYDVTVKSGPSFATQREETREALIEIMRQVPAAAPFIGDLLLNHMDFQGAEIAAKRLKHLLPPEIQKAESEDVTGADNPEAAALQQQLQAKEAEMEQAKEQVMAEIKKMQEENELLKSQAASDKANKQVDVMKVQAEIQLKGRDLALKEQESLRKDKELELKIFEAQKDDSANVELESTKLAVDVKQTNDQLEYDAAEKELDRRATAEQNALDRENELQKICLSKSEEVEANAHEGMEQTTMMLAMQKALTAPKMLVRDENGQVIGVETVIDEGEPS